MVNKLEHTECKSALLPIRDAMEVIHGKWKLPVYISIRESNSRFREIERSIPEISFKVLSKEFKRTGAAPANKEDCI